MYLGSNVELEWPLTAVQQALRAHNYLALAAHPDQVSRPLQAFVRARQLIAHVAKYIRDQLSV
jgi:hypothetical protein